MSAKTMAGVLKEHQPSRWRSFTNENEILRCCKQDFGNLTRKPKPDDNAKTWEAFTAHQAEILAAAGYGLVADNKPTVISYVVVDRDGGFIRDFGMDRPAAQAFADEWIEDCKITGVDWDYHVAEIVEATA